MRRSSFPTASATARAVGTALREGSVEAADRLVGELISWVLRSQTPAPADVLAEPESTGDERYDALLATGLAYALLKRGEQPAVWMRSARPLSHEWLWDGDSEASDAYREFIREQTPPLFREKSILLRERDLITL